MLLSPGHSPRQISSPSPSLVSDSDQIHSNTSKCQTVPKRQVTVLDEDSYVAFIEKIIERDFFPDIPKLRDRFDWLQASRSHDPVQIRDAQLKIMDRRGRKASNFDPEGNQTKTPGSAFFENSTPTESGKIKTPGSCLEDDVQGEYGGSIESSLSLDAFLRRYTSEDNHSFSKVIEKVNRKRRERYEYLTEGEKADMKSIEDLKRDRITDGYGTSDQPPSTLESWNYTAKNLLMYHPADQGEVALTKDEMDVRVMGLTKEINRTNTRFHCKIEDSRPKEEDTIAVLYAPLASSTPIPISLSDRNGDKSRKYDLDDLRKTPNQFYVESEKKADNGYNYVKTPSPAPGAGESPFITWGEIDGTPLRLETEDTPIGIGGGSEGPHFKMACPPTRDVKAHSLSREAARRLRERSNMFKKPPLPSPIRGGSASPGARTLSQAAQKFVRNAMAKSSNSVDETLRASYRGSSPSLGTPKSARSLSRFGRDESPHSGSPSVRERGSNPPW